MTIKCELPAFKFRSGHGTGVREGRDKALPLVVREPECLVSHDGTACRAAEDVTDIRILRHQVPSGIDLMVEIVARPERVIPPKPVQIGMKVVCSPFRDDVNYRPGIATEFGEKVARDDAKFLHGIRIERGQPRLRQRQSGDLGIVVVGAVHQKVVVSFAGPVHRKASQQRIALDRSGRKKDQLVGIAQN